MIFGSQCRPGILVFCARIGKEIVEREVLENRKVEGEVEVIMER